MEIPKKIRDIEAKLGLNLFPTWCGVKVLKYDRRGIYWTAWYHSSAHSRSNLHAPVTSCLSASDRAPQADKADHLA